MTEEKRIEVEDLMRKSADQQVDDLNRLFQEAFGILGYPQSSDHAPLELAAKLLEDPYVTLMTHNIGNNPDALIHLNDVIPIHKRHLPEHQARLIAKALTAFNELDPKPTGKPHEKLDAVRLTAIGVLINPPSPKTHSNIEVISTRAQQIVDASPKATRILSAFRSLPKPQ